MKLQLGSIFRDSEKYLPAYLDRLRRVAEMIVPLRLCWLEGDSKDATWAILNDAADWFRACGVDVRFTKFDTGKPYYPSVDVAYRWRHLETVWNRCLELFGADAEYAATVESDLIWEPDVLYACMERIERGVADVVYPCLMHGASSNWYDTHGFERNGRKFSARPPYCDDWNAPSPFVEVDTGGGLVVASGDVFVDAIWANDCIVTFPPEVRKVLDKRLAISHP